MIIKIDDKKWFIREDIRTGFYIENGDVFAVPVQVDGLPHDDKGVTTNVDDFDWPQKEIEKLKRMIFMVLGSDKSEQNGNNAAFTDALKHEDNKNR